MGFYESIDFTRAAKRHGERGVMIYTYMAHHQGMSLRRSTTLCIAMSCSGVFTPISAFGPWNPFCSSVFR